MIRFVIFALIQVALPLVQPDLFTEPVEFDADDPAIFYNTKNPSKSFIVATDKEKDRKDGTGGGLYVFNLKGKIVSKFKVLDRPNNVDVVPSFSFGGKTVPLVVTTERLQNRLRIFQLSLEGTLIDVTGKTEVFKGETGEDKAPMGVACGILASKTLAFVTPKAGKRNQHVEQLELVFNRQTKKVDAVSKRRFGSFSMKKETESIFVDTKNKQIFYSDELVGVRQYSLTNLDKEARLIQNPNHTGDHEGLAAWNNVLVSTDQRVDGSVFWYYDLKSGKPMGGFETKVDETDGIEICAKPMGSKFPKGIMVAMNSKGKNFAIFDLRTLPKPRK
jgi:3-phytase